MPTANDGIRFRAVAKRHSAEQSLLGIWKKGKEVEFYRLRPPAHPLADDWTEAINLDEVFQQTRQQSQKVNSVAITLDDATDDSLMLDRQATKLRAGRETMVTLERAIEIAAKAHTGQKDKGGDVYILHPLRLMLRMSSTEERIAAVLHVCSRGFRHDHLKQLTDDGCLAKLL